MTDTRYSEAIELAKEVIRCGSADIAFEADIKLAQALLSMHEELLACREVANARGAAAFDAEHRLKKAEELVKQLWDCGDLTCGECSENIASYFSETGEREGKK